MIFGLQGLSITNSLGEVLWLTVVPAALISLVLAEV